MTFQPRRILKSLYHCFLMLIMLEVFSYPAYYVVNDAAWSPSAIQTSLDDALAVISRPGKDGNPSFSSINRLTPHPYLGYTINPTEAERKRQPLTTKFGFLAEREPLEASADPNAAIVGISGGSFAEYMFMDPESRRRLHAGLEKLPQFAGKKLYLVMLAIAGYGQPQGLLSLTYYLFEGGRLDMLIHIDGNNEAFNPRSAILDMRMNPTYPTHWPIFFIGQVNAENQALMGELVMWRHLRYQAASAFSHVRYSIFCSLLWKPLDQYLNNQVAEAQKKLAAPDAQKTPYFVHGAGLVPKPTPQALVEYSLKSWVAGSTQMYYLSQNFHFDYIHFLQPTLHIKDSKPLTSNEQKARDSLGYYQSFMPQTYARYIAEIPALNAKGIPTFSLVDIYKNHPETLYADGLGHVYEPGKRIAADAIVAKILELKKVSPKSQPAKEKKP